MANTQAIDGVLVDGQLTVETKDVTNPTSPLQMTTFTTTAMKYSDNPLRPGFFISCFKDKGLSSERTLTLAFTTDAVPRFTGYTEAFTTKTETEPYSFDIIDYTGKIETMEITRDKRRYNVIEFEILAKRSDNNETRKLTGKGHIFITNLSMAL
ncbi:hypothetical protein [Pseudomonas arsenicoxydans]|uniref:Uncharacterized protein n=1 Tax=Pseudomonas arsenicoxydans TaxID=702115 RepID=A0A502HS85_9PSED|nr:hypothetical protein [Pseudomonas arsenicoxydans]TPG76715.1 hypothetical protein EAH78_16270 [Pseudomonas arsenicoxydans]